MLRVAIAFILRVVALIATLWFVKRLFHSGFGGQHVRGRASAGKDIPSSKMVKDPICGMYMDPRLAIRIDQKGDSLFFCSEECRQKFLADRS